VKIEYGKRPPNFDQIAAVFPSARKTGIIFCYGDVIYVSSNTPLSEPLVAHETMHSTRQDTIGVEQWWHRYLHDTSFRFEEELLAHSAEYKAFADCGRNERRAALKTIAQRLSSPLYGSMVTKAKASTMLKDTAHA